MLWDEQAVRANIRNRDGKRVYYLGRGDQLTSTARDFLHRERIEILPGSQARPERYRLLSGGYAEKKPEHMTHLNGEILVPKTHPRIRFRGKMDTFEAELILCQRIPGAPEGALGEILDFARKIIRCDVLEEPLRQDILCGLTQDEQRGHSHMPQDYYGQPHFMPQASDGPVIAGLNRARCFAREAELAAVEAFSNREGNLIREDIPKALNRMSSMLYLLMIQEKAKSC